MSINNFFVYSPQLLIHLPACLLLPLHRRRRPIKSHISSGVVDKKELRVNLAHLASIKNVNMTRLIVCREEAEIMNKRTSGQQQEEDDDGV
jgi:hypothetical protein